MDQIRPLPGYLVSRYKHWHDTAYADGEAWYRRLAAEGQHPRAMVISCCDSRVQVDSIFGAEQGDFFVHRNIANLVPPYAPDGDHHGTSAAVEYAVSALKVAHIIVLGHSKCGGVKGCHDMCAGRAPELEKSTSFIGNWLDILRPGYEAVQEIADDARRIPALERQAVLTSLKNLTTFPFISEAREKGLLTLHGLWIDIGEGRLEQYDPGTKSFQVV